MCPLTLCRSSTEQALCGVIRPFHMGWIIILYTLFIFKLISLPTHFSRTWVLLKGIIFIICLQKLHSIGEWLCVKPLFYNNIPYIYAMIPTWGATCLLLSTVTRCSYPIQKIVTGNVAYIVWSSESAVATLPTGTDTFFLDGDKIRFHTVADYRVKK
jgi:hypothetical protein